MIKINNIEIPIYPGTYDDDPVVIKTDSYSINGSVERHRFPSKKQVKMKFDVVSPTQISFFRDLFESSGAVQFYNDQSNYGVLSFSGVIMECSSGEYKRGGSLLTDLSITIRES